MNRSGLKKHEAEPLPHDQRFKLARLRRGQEKLMRFRIKRHRFRLRQSLHIFDNRVLIRTILVNYSDRSFAIGIEDKVGSRVESSSIHGVADGSRG